MGISKTLACINDNFFWPGMCKDVASFVVQCLDCQHTKYETKKQASLLCPLPVSLRPWEDFSLDFIVGLPPFRGYTKILVVVNRFSKGIHLGMLPTQHSTHSVAMLFMDIVGKFHGMPQSLISGHESVLAGLIPAKWHDFANELCLPSADQWSDGGIEQGHQAMSSSLRASEAIIVGQVFKLDRVVLQHLDPFWFGFVPILIHLCQEAPFHSTIPYRHFKAGRSG